MLDGEGVSPRAFRGQGVRGVTIRGLRITGYMPPTNAAAVDGIDSIGWVIEDNEIDHNGTGANRTFGLRLGDDMAVRGNRIHHNVWVGIAGYEADRVVIERNEIYANPPVAVNDTIGEAANMKLLRCGNVIVRDNEVRDGPMIGMWFDTMKPDNTIEANRVVSHGGAGIWYEVSYRATIRRNYIENAGYSGCVHQRLAAKRRHPGDELAGRLGARQYGGRFAERHHRPAGVRLPERRVWCERAAQSPRERKHGRHAERSDRNCEERRGRRRLRFVEQSVLKQPLRDSSEREAVLLEGPWFDRGRVESGTGRK